MIRRLYVLRVLGMIEAIFLIGVVMGALWHAGFINCSFC